MARVVAVCHCLPKLSDIPLLAVILYKYSSRPFELGSLPASFSGKISRAYARVHSHRLRVGLRHTLID
jgi:hypothetical protein